LLASRAGLAEAVVALDAFTQERRALHQQPVPLRRS
jgi:hypothetical protein